MLSGCAVKGMVDFIPMEPDGTAMNLKDSMSEEMWKSYVDNWDSWSVAFTESIWPDERKFYFYQKLETENVTSVEQYPDSSRMAFQVLIPGIGARSKTSRGKLRISPYGLELTVINGVGHYPPMVDDKIPMCSVGGWSLLEEEGGKICIYVDTSKALGGSQVLMDIVLKTKTSKRIADCLKGLSRQAHDALQTEPERRPSLYGNTPEEYLDRYPFNCAHMDKESKEIFTELYGNPLARGMPFEVPKALGVISHNPRPKTPICYARGDLR